MSKIVEWSVLNLTVPMITLSECPLQIYTNTTALSIFQVGKTNSNSSVNIWNRFKRTTKKKNNAINKNYFLSKYNLYSFRYTQVPLTD